MTEYINKEKLIEQYPELDGYTFADVPTIEIVHCEECRWWKRKKDTKYGFCHNCQHGYLSNRWDISVERKTKADHYCADAIRRE